MMIVTHQISHSWESSSSSASWEIPRILWYSKDHYHVHKGLQLVSVLSTINPCVLSGFCRKVDENCGLVGCYTVKSDTLEIGPLGCSETLHNIPEERICLQISAVHTHPSYFHIIHFNIIHNFVPICFQMVSFSFFRQNPICTSPLHHTCHMPQPTNYSWLDHLNARWLVKITKNFIRKLFPISYYFHPLWPKYLPQNSIFKHS